MLQFSVLPDASHTIWNCKYHVVFAPKYRHIIYAPLETELLAPRAAEVMIFFNNILGIT